VWVFVLGVVAGVAVMLLINWLRGTTTQTQVVEDLTGGDIKVVALGDSYISGEGAKQFFLGTDTDTNRCRRAPTAYPYIIKQAMNLRLIYAACSGALTKNILTDGQYPESEPSQLGGRPQIAVLRENTDARVVLLMIGGNDAKFGEIGRSCALEIPSCLRKSKDWMKNLEVVQDQLATVYQEVKQASPDSALFVMTYPNPFGAEYCHDIPLMSEAEYTFLRDEFVPSLDAKIREAAKAADVEVIDLEHAFDGRRICEVAPEDAALNIVGISRRSPGDVDIARAFHNSFHPNALGHTLFARIVGPKVAIAAFSNE
jgi:lysophospholipase L1-like esterase